MIGAEDCQSLCCQIEHHKTDKTNDQICVLQASQFCQNINKKILVAENKIIKSVSISLDIKTYSAIKPDYISNNTFYNNFSANFLTNPFKENNPPLII